MRLRYFTRADPFTVASDRAEAAYRALCLPWPDVQDDDEPTLELQLAASLVAGLLPVAAAEPASALRAAQGHAHVKAMKAVRPRCDASHTLFCAFPLTPTRLSSANAVGRLLPPGWWQVCAADVDTCFGVTVAREEEALDEAGADDEPPPAFEDLLFADETLDAEAEEARGAHPPKKRETTSSRF